MTRRYTVARVARDRMADLQVFRALARDEYDNHTPDPSGDGPPVKEENENDNAR